MTVPGHFFFPRPHPTGVVTILMTTLLLAGCGSDGDGELRQWMGELRATTKPRTFKLTETQQFTPQDYQGGAEMEPFNPQKLTQALRRESDPSGLNMALIAPEMARRKEPLEAYPLDAMKMVGSLNKDGLPTALISVDKLLYQVRVGSHLGQSYGKVVAITETGLKLREIVQDTGGDWMEKMTTLELQEGSGANK